MNRSGQKDERKDLVCMPVLSLLDLLVLAVSGVNKRAARLRYGKMSRYLKGMNRFCRIPEAHIENFLSFISGMLIEKLDEGQDLKDYPRLHLAAMEKTTFIAGQLISEMKDNPAVKGIKELIGQDPATAYAAKYLSWHQMFENVLSVTVCSAEHGPGTQYLVVCDPAWPASWREALRGGTGGISPEIFKWPGWYKGARYSACKIRVVFGMTGAIFSYLVKRGVKAGTPQVKRHKLIAEFVDPRRMGGGPQDADYWIDGKNIGKGDVLFFLTEKQKRILIKDGYGTNDIKKLFCERSYSLAVLDELPYSPASVGQMAGSYFRAVRHVLANDASVLAEALLEAWFDYLEFLPLFIHHSADNLIYLTLPNGHTGVRFNDAVVTGLCRKNGIRSVGCQTRPVYARRIEYCFDCFDIYLSWGSVWQEMLKDNMAFVGETVVVGCIYLDDLYHHISRAASSKNSGEEKRITISVFNCDITINDQFTVLYNRNFMINCVKLAKISPRCKFQVKTKDPEHVDLLLNDDEFYRAYSEVKGNFSFIKQGRGDYEDILVSSDIIIAIGYTTPGAEAILLGKRGIYYSELEGGGQPFSHLPYVVARDYDELERSFIKAGEDYAVYSDINSDKIDKLDPYRDGRALERILRELSGK